LQPLLVLRVFKPEFCLESIFAFRHYVRVGSGVAGTGSIPSVCSSRLFHCSGGVWTADTLGSEWFGLSLVGTLASLPCCAVPPRSCLHGASAWSCAVGSRREVRACGGRCRAMFVVCPPTVRGASSGGSVPSSRVICTFLSSLCRPVS